VALIYQLLHAKDLINRPGSGSISVTMVFSINKAKLLGLN